MQRKLWTTTVAIGLMFSPLAWSDTVRACPGCKEAVAAQDIESDSDVYSPGQLARAYNYSIYFMLSMPALILTFFGTACYMLTRRQNQGQCVPESLADGSDPSAGSTVAREFSAS